MHVHKYAMDCTLLTSIYFSLRHLIVCCTSPTEFHDMCRPSDALVPEKRYIYYIYSVITFRTDIQFL